MKNHIHPGDTVIDIGANIGYETIWAASLVGEQGKVFSFEPLPNLVKQIQKTLKRNNFKNVNLVNKAVGEHVGSVEIFIHPKDAGLTSIKNKEGAKFSIEVPLTTLSSEVPSNLKITFIKVDVEGYEFEVLKGGRELILNNKPLIVFEFTPGLYEQSYEGKSEVFLKYMSELGYNLRILGEEKTLSPSDFSKFVKKYQSTQGLNLIAQY